MDSTNCPQQNYSLAPSSPVVISGSRRNTSMAVLVIRNFPSNTTESDLRKVFEEFGTITAITVVAGNRKKHAFLDFESLESMKAAVNCERPIMLDDKVLQVEEKYSNSGGGDGQGGSNVGASTSRRNNSTAVLIIRNLPSVVNESDLRDVFKEFGTITACNIVRSRKHAFLDFESMESMKAAVSCDRPIMLHDTVLQVDEKYSAAGGGGRGAAAYRKEKNENKSDVVSTTPVQNMKNSGEQVESTTDTVSTRSPSLPSTARRNNSMAVLIIKNLPSVVNESDLREVFEEFGSITAITIVRSRKHAFLDFESMESMKSAVNCERPIMLQDKILQVDEKYSSSGDIGPSASRRNTSMAVLIIRNFPSNATENDLREVFEEFGTITAITIVRNRTHAFLDFESLESMNAAVNCEKPFMLQDKVLQVEEKYSTSQ